jgi:DNA replication and repair protein RecF
MDRLFTDPAGGRRKFLDRLVLALEPGHARQMAAFENAAAQRNRVLGESADPDWLTGLEHSMARHAVAATAMRGALINQLNAALGAGIAAPFPPVSLGLACTIAARLAQMPALAVEEALREALAAARPQDAASRTASLGPQKADLLINDARTGRAAAESSTGQQKTMLLGIILGHAALITALRGAPPLLLLDEPLVHLDTSHREALLAALDRQGLQAWLTGTDPEPFAGANADCYSIKDASIEAL